MARARDISKERRAGLCFAEVVIPNKKGLHARASAQFVRCAAGFTSKVRVTREGHTVGGTSIMGLMMLGAAMGDTIVIHVVGPGADEALAKLAALVEGRFGEE